MKRVVAGWIDGLTVSGLSLQHQLRMDLHEQLTRASLIKNDGGEYCIEIPGLVALGIGIFQRSFNVEGTIVRVAPYPSGVRRSTTGS